MHRILPKKNKIKINLNNNLFYFINKDIKCNRSLTFIGYFRSRLVIIICIKDNIMRCKNYIFINICPYYSRGFATITKSLRLFLSCNNYELSIKYIKRLKNMTV